MKFQEDAERIERWVKHLATRNKWINSPFQLMKLLILEVWMREIYDYGE